MAVVLFSLLQVNDTTALGLHGSQYVVDGVGTGNSWCLVFCLLSKLVGYTHIHTYTHTYTHTHIHTYTHTHIHTHTHTLGERGI